MCKCTANCKWLLNEHSVIGHLLLSLLWWLVVSLQEIPGWAWSCRGHILEILWSSIPEVHLWAWRRVPSTWLLVEGHCEAVDLEPGLWAPFLSICQRHAWGDLGWSPKSLLAFEPDLHTFWFALSASATKFFMGILVRRNLYILMDNQIPLSITENFKSFHLLPFASLMLMLAHPFHRSWLSCHFFREAFLACISFAFYELS